MTSQQFIASDPKHSVWVAASAGSGKTKVLTDRVLRLLLQGVEPERILCITYTRAAAAEMASRINAELSSWVVLQDNELAIRLQQLIGTTPTDSYLVTARSLFAKVIDSADGISLQTIHSLCQSLLRRFSLEAGVSPHFRVIEEREANILLDQAKHNLLLSYRDKSLSAPLYAVIRSLAERITEATFNNLLAEIINNRANFQNIFTKFGDDIECIKRNIIRSAGLYVDISNLQDITPDYLARKYFRYNKQHIDDLVALHNMLADERDNIADNKLYENLGKLLTAQPVDAQTDITEWVAFMLTAKHKPRSMKQLLSKKLCDKYPQFVELINKEQQICFEYQQQLLALQTALYSCDLLILAQSLLAIYDSLKNNNAVLDFEDLIATTNNLLNREDIAPWILYKLDGTIEHILVDEAQDTSNIQWKLISALAGEFFTGESAVTEHRTIFVVGDEKQSIYSFQGAQPESFAHMRQYFSQLITAADKSYKSVELSLSFRSTPAILQFVDAVFAGGGYKEGVILSEQKIQHQAHRKAAGRVELWPLFTAEEAPQRIAWHIPKDIVNIDLPEQRLANEIAGTISNWLRDSRMLPARNREVKPSDILILVRKRSRFFHYLIAALKKYNIPLSGADRMELSSHIAVQDMLALAQFLLFPQDDLNLACLLKSPLFAVEEHVLLDLCTNRTTSLWQHICSLEDCSDSSFKDVLYAKSVLSQLLSKVDYLAPYELFATILNLYEGRLRFRQRLGFEVDDPLNEFLDIALQYEQLHTPSLQGFVHWFSRAQTQIKRDMEQVHDEVRVMTIHGAKGLQAPIVFLPDTTSVPLINDKILWQEDSFLWVYDANAECAAVAKIKSDYKQHNLREYRRLLYVALTRAEDELYIAGWVGGRKNQQEIPQECWYSRIDQAMRSYDNIIKEEDGKLIWQDMLYSAGSHSHIDKYTSFIDNQTNIITAAELVTNSNLKFPDWMHKKPRPEPSPSQPLMPSKPSLCNITADSPLASDNKQLKRGIAIHSLLEILPDVQPEYWQQTGLILLEQYLPNITVSQRNSLLQEVISVITNPDFAPVFADGSKAELPISANIERGGHKKTLLGRIDRVAILHDKILIVDYKTTSNIPESAANIPHRFLQQLADYAAAMSQIYPQHDIKTAILWTAKPLLMPIPAKYIKVA